MLNISPLSKVSQQGVVLDCNDKFLDLFHPIEIIPTETTLYSLLSDSYRFKDADNLLKTTRAILEAYPESNPDTIYYMLYESAIVLDGLLHKLVIWSDIDESFFGIYTKDTELELFKQLQIIKNVHVYDSIVNSLNNRIRNLEDAEANIQQAKKVLGVSQPQSVINHT